MPDYLFFLSYARLDGDAHLEKFFHDLASEVRSRKGLVGGDIGFFDQEGIEPGEEWPEKIAEALQTSRVFVYLHSPTYFTREYCGKEWQIFYSRLDQYVAVSPEIEKRPPLIVPVLWVPVRRPGVLPDAVSDIQYQHTDFGQEYAKEGLRYLLRLRKHRDDYETFLARFADKLIQATEEHPLPQSEDLPPLKEVQSAFHEAVEVTKPVTKAVQALGPGFAWFVFVAGLRAEMENVRKKRDFYGQDEKRRDWRPYLGGLTDTVGYLAQDVATSEQMICEALPLDEDLLQRLREAEQNNNIVVIIVDPWTMRLETYTEVMQHYDETRFKNCGVLIAWNVDDEETSIHESGLQDLVHQAFERNILWKTTCFRDNVCSRDELETELLDTMIRVRKQIESTGPTRPMDSTRPLPGVSGPS